MTLMKTLQCLLKVIAGAKWNGTTDMPAYEVCKESFIWTSYKINTEK